MIFLSEDLGVGRWSIKLDVVAEAQFEMGREREVKVNNKQGE